jgi:pimeloyl-ACP methyl ester carboxylesterase
MRTTDGEKVVHVNDIDLFYQDYGSGSPLVLLHGWFGSNAFWDPYINALTQEYRVIVPDFRGHGRSTNPNDYAFSERDFAHDIFALLDHLGIERFKGVGFSSGGMTFLHMATEQSKRIEAMILIGTVHYFPSERNDIASEMTMENLEPEFLSLMQKWHKKDDEQIRFLVKLFGQVEMKLSPDSLAGIMAQPRGYNGPYIDNPWE